MSTFTATLKEIFAPKKRNNCPHCGGVHCIGLCGVDKKAAKGPAYFCGKLLTDPPGVLRNDQGKLLSFAENSDAVATINQICAPGEYCRLVADIVDDRVVTLYEAHRIG